MASKSKSMFSQIRPSVEQSKAIKLVKELFCLEVSSIQELASYDDRNFLVEVCRYDSPTLNLAEFAATAAGQKNDRRSKKFVFKIINSRETYCHEFADAMVSAMRHFDKFLGHKYSCPVPIPSLNGSVQELVDIRIPHDKEIQIESPVLENYEKDEFLGCTVDENGTNVLTMKHYVRLLSFVPGKIYPDGKLDDDLLLQTGRLVANVVRVFKDFTCPALVNKKGIWDMKYLLQLCIPKYLDPIKESARQKIETVFAMFKNNVVSVMKDLPMQTIHSDLNEQNIIIENHNGRRKITGLIDFGDITHSCRIFEIGACMSYIGLLQISEFNKIAGTILAGYLSEEELTQLELDVLYYCILGRLAMSLVIGNYQYQLCDTSNDYLLTTSKPGWALLDMLLESKDCPKSILDTWLSYCNKKA